MGTANAGDYPPDWSEIARSVKEEAGWCCVRCGHPHDPSDGYCLTVHHLDGDPSNCEWWNLAALCQRCHLHFQGRLDLRQGWMFEHPDWFKPYVAGYYASILGLELTYRQVLERQEVLIAMQAGC